MKVMAFNGSPRRKNWNTVTLLEKALEGARYTGAETELVQLYNLKFSGCLSCFQCKKTDRKKDGVCALKDDLSSVLDRIKDADALILGSPIYAGVESAAMRAFLERLSFPYLPYSRKKKTHFPRRINTALIYTMNVQDNQLEKLGYDKHFSMTKCLMETLLGACELLLATDTMQFKNHTDFDTGLYDTEAKAKRHKEVFPEVCERAFELGVRMASGIVPAADEEHD